MFPVTQVLVGIKLDVNNINCSKGTKVLLHLLVGGLLWNECLGLVVILVSLINI